MQLGIVTCSACSSPLVPGAAVCPHCGRAAVAGPPVAFEPSSAQSDYAPVATYGMPPTGAPANASAPPFAQAPVAAWNPTTAFLQVVQPRTGFFLFDVQLHVTLDGQPFYFGSFTSGFDVTVEVATGRHVLQTIIDPGGIGRQRLYEITIPAPESALYRGERPRVVAKLDYSRFWGNFSKKLDIS